MLKNNKYQKLNWSKNYGLIPSIIQHTNSGEVLMLGYMTKESLIVTERTGFVTFFSRSKKRLWTKGEQSGNLLQFTAWYPDCDLDALLILAIPKNELTCHKKTSSCFLTNSTIFNFLYKLENIISNKFNLSNNSEQPISSYTYNLYRQGIERIAQKVGEEGLETALAAVSNNSNALINESADLIFHLLILLQFKSLGLHNVIHTLQTRHTS